MTQSINPNTRAAFADNNGRLTKYGQSVISRLYEVLNLVGESNSLDDLLTAFDVDIATANLRSRQQTFQNDIEEIENDYETAAYKARIKELERRVNSLETCIETTSNKDLIRRIEDIEAQL